MNEEILPLETMPCSRCGAPVYYDLITSKVPDSRGVVDYGRYRQMNAETGEPHFKTCGGGASMTARHGRFSAVGRGQ